MKLKYSNCGKTKKKSNCDENQKLNLGLNSKTQIVMKLKNSYCGQKTQNSKLKTKKVKKKKSNCDKTKKKLKW